jgi:hypothetical protein
MKGRISIKEFIQRVKEELVDAQDKTGSPFYELNEVTLEISFALEATGKAGFDLYVVELGSEAKAQQSHKVSLKLTPLRVQRTLPQEIASGPTLADAPGAPAPASETSTAAPTGGGGGGGGRGGIISRNMPVYDKIRTRD